MWYFYHTVFYHMILSHGFWKSCDKFITWFVTWQCTTGNVPEARSLYHNSLVSLCQSGIEFQSWRTVMVPPIVNRIQSHFSHGWCHNRDWKCITNLHVLHQASSPWSQGKCQSDRPGFTTQSFLFWAHCLLRQQPDSQKSNFCKC